MLGQSLPSFILARAAVRCPSAVYSSSPGSCDPARLCGIVPVKKPEGWSSNDVVQKVRATFEKEARRQSGSKKIRVKVGHGGTLDPLATGVLILGVGQATKILGEYTQGPKAYRAVGLLGSESDTMDSMGKVTETVDVSHISTALLQSALPQFRGQIMQRPPAYSALWKDGKRMYELARQGQSIEVEPRPVQVHKLDLLPSYALPHFGLSIECGGGTYVRSLISDIARAVGGRAYMTELVRTRQGNFCLEDCLSEEQWRDAAALIECLRHTEKV